MRQLLVTPSMGKRLIAKALAADLFIQTVLKKGVLVIVAGTTNGYVAEEILAKLGVTDFSRRYFFRGVTLPPSQAVTEQGRLSDKSEFPGDVVIVDGVWQKGKTVNDVADRLKEGDVILKGANAFNLEHKQAAVLIGHPKAGTAAFILQAVLGRRVRLIIPVGLEKRVNADLSEVARRLNAPGAGGYRFMPLSGEVFTEIDAIKKLTGAHAELVAAGGVCGAEGSCLLAVTGTAQQEQAAEKLWQSIASEPPFAH